MGGSDTFAARIARMHFALLCGMLVVPSTLRAVSSIPECSCEVLVNVRVSRCGCMLSSHICVLMYDITFISYLHVVKLHMVGML